MQDMKKVKKDRSSITKRERGNGAEEEKQVLFRQHYVSFGKGSWPAGRMSAELSGNPRESWENGRLNPFIPSLGCPCPPLSEAWLAAPLAPRAYRFLILTDGCHTPRPMLFTWSSLQKARCTHWCI